VPVCVVTDSTCDLPPQWVARYGIRVVPALVTLDGRAYRDGLELSRADFYRRLPALRPLPTTAAPSAGDFAAAYHRCGDNDIVVVALAAALSGIFNAARLGAEGWGERVTLIDSGNLSMGLGWQVLAAAEAAVAGAGAAQVVRAVQSTQQRLTLLAALDTVEYLRRGGRASALTALLGELLQIKPLLEVRAGQVIPLGRLRTRSKARAGLAERIEALGPLQRVAVLHAAAEAEARELAERLAALSQEPPIVVEATTVIGTHVGPGALGVAAISKA
jgi:DegV family protein with EDD domain